MTDITEHYSVDDIERRILDAIRDAGLDPEQRLTPVQLAGLDHFHTGGYASSMELLRRSELNPEHRVLDIGAGLAGAARMIVAETGCRVDCIELARDYCIGAELLNRITGMSDHVTVHEGSATAMSFEDGSYEVAWMQNVGMNILDKVAFYEEVARVLKPGGRFVFQEMLSGGEGECDYPLPWATEPEDNALVTIDEMMSLLSQAGFEVADLEDASEEQLTPPTPGSNSTPVTPQLSLSAYVDDLANKAWNAQACLADGRIRFVRAVFRKIR